MKNFLLILPIAFLVAYSQIVVKWRTASEAANIISNASVIQHLLKFLMDPVVLSAYIAALLASFAWLFVVTKLPLTVAFPVYIGVTFAMVILGGWLFLSEALNATKIIAISLIFMGIVIGVKS